MGWVALIVIVGVLFWVHCARGMSVKDRIEVALDIARSSNFAVAEGFDAAAKEDPELIGWMQAGKDCVMLFRSENGSEVREIVDFASGSFHPGLVIHYRNGTAVRTDAAELVDARLSADRAPRVAATAAHARRRVAPQAAVVRPVS